MSRPAAVILAAGASTRMGRCKALIEWRGRPLVAHLVGLARRCEPIVVVTGATPLPESATAGARVVHNARWQAGPMSSLQCGLAALPVQRAVLVLTVDRPHLRADTVDALLDAWAREPTRVWQPILGERRGHPVLYPAEVARALSAAAPDATPRDVLAQPHVALLRRSVPTDDPAVLDNIDHPEDLARLPLL